MATMSHVSVVLPCGATVGFDLCCYSVCMRSESYFECFSQVWKEVGQTHGCCSHKPVGEKEKLADPSKARKSEHWNVFFCCCCL